MIADRDDLLVTIAPGAGHGSPAAFLPAHATIEIDGEHLDGIDPGSLTPARVADQNRIPTVWGLFTHECAHARHSVWRTPPGTPAGAAAAAELLEEPRIEAAQIRRRPADRRWLRASSIALILSGTVACTSVSDTALTRHAAATAAVLLLARTDGGILETTETRPVEAAVTDALGAPTLAALREIWLEALTVDDDDTEAMLTLGQRWCRILGLDPDTALPTPDTPPTAATPADPDPSEGSSATPAVDEPGPLAEAVTAALSTIRVATAAESAPIGPAEAAEAEAAARADDGKIANRAATAAATVFAINTTERTTETRAAIWAERIIEGARTPRPAERRAARALARALDTAGIRDRAAARGTSALPPGRLSMRGVRAVDAQRAAGAIPTAEPFTRVIRRETATPPLRVGVACDVSGSMGAFTEPVASAAWILAAATAHTAVPAVTASVLFGQHVCPLTHPGQVPAQVTQFGAPDNYEELPGAIDALDGALGLARPGAARLLVVISDGQYRHRGRTGGQARVDRLRHTGCGVLWLAPAAGRSWPLTGATVEELSDPATAARAIGRAAVAALRAAQ
ncbi:MAG TPA: hypothetical protein VNP03_12445 [Pseudonocardia sp.]|nr:hypothetical protein [Pseudonocardia sp.]